MKILFAALLFILAPFAAAAQSPDLIESADQLSRTMSPRGYPYGYGCLIASGANAGFTDGSSVLPTPIPLKSQILVTNNSTISATYCFTQDPAPTINRAGYFSADSDSFYAAGRGHCFVLGPNVTMPMLVTRNMFLSNTSNKSPGARPWKCSNSNRPCYVANDCDGGGTCAASNGASTHVYLWAIHRAGASNDSDACDAR